MSSPRRSLPTLVTLAAPLSLWLAAACGDNRAAPDAAPPSDAPPDAIEVDGPPADPLATIAGTGLCVDAGCTQVNAGIRAYVPQFPLWDDTATKRRWIYLPPGTKIDTTDMSHWRFPVGTKVWKEFARDGVRVETRFIMKQLDDDNAPGAWFYTTYVWNDAQDEAVALTTGLQNAHGTQHDIPSRSECRGCHERLRPTRVLGFDAIQLDADAAPELTDLDDLIAADLLTTAPPAGASPHFPVPGVAVDRAALGYFHGNCGHCHNPSSDVADVTPLDLRLRTDLLATVTATPAYATTVGVDASIPYTEDGVTYTKLIVPAGRAESAVLARTSSMLLQRFMPNLAVEDVDPAGQTAIGAWIDSL